MAPVRPQDVRPKQSISGESENTTLFRQMWMAVIEDTKGGRRSGDYLERFVGGYRDRAGRRHAIRRSTKWCAADPGPKSFFIMAGLVPAISLSACGPAERGALAMRQFSHGIAVQGVGWVERSDTHQLQFAGAMGFAKGSTHPTGWAFDRA
jgi:hypothetical protein